MREGKRTEGEEGKARERIGGKKYGRMRAGGAFYHMSAFKLVVKILKHCTHGI